VISRCCIFLQLKHGNVDALQFSAICILLHTHLPFDSLASFFFCLFLVCLGCSLHLLGVFFQYNMTHSLGRVQEKDNMLMITLD
jgi:hypothetical protein